MKERTGHPLSQVERVHGVDGAAMKTEEQIREAVIKCSNTHEDKALEEFMNNEMKDEDKQGPVGGGLCLDCTFLSDMDWVLKD